MQSSGGSYLRRAIFGPPSGVGSWRGRRLEEPECFHQFKCRDPDEYREHNSHEDPPQGTPEGVEPRQPLWRQRQNRPHEAAGVKCGIHVASGDGTGQSCCPFVKNNDGWATATCPT